MPSKARGLRIVGGAAGGRRLVAPKGSARPTTDRVKEALFNVLGAHVVDAAVLDLYAGSGALGIEALSRGAGSAVFVDDDPAAVNAIRDNLESTRLGEDARVVGSSVSKFLASVARHGQGAERHFDLVFLDPPYDTPTAEVEDALAALAASRCTSPGCRFVVERARVTEPPALPPGWRTEFQRAYGDTLVVVATS
jgi:16S rRNA (guanine(966)-N(2))-methyltransferase RsmD